MEMQNGSKIPTKKYFGGKVRYVPGSKVLGTPSALQEMDFSDDAGGITPGYSLMINFEAEFCSCL